MSEEPPPWVHLPIRPESDNYEFLKRPLPGEPDYQALDHRRSPDNQAIVDRIDSEYDAALLEERSTRRKREIAELQRQQILDRPDATPLEKLIAEDTYQTAEGRYQAARQRARRATNAWDRAFDDFPTLQEEAERQAEEDQTLLAFSDADSWLREWLLPTWRRQNARWCAKWWLHTEAVTRIEAMWRSWEHLRGDGAVGPSVWWRDHGDYHLSILTAQDGPFALCDARKQTHNQVSELPAIPCPN